MTTGSKPTILICDDSILIRAMLRQQLQTQNYTVVEAEDGDQAIDLALKSDPDVILLDVEMPKRDGHSVLREIKANEMIADVPVVFLTARATTEEVVSGLRLGAHDYLAKPFEPIELLARVSAALRVKALHDELRSRNEELDRTSRIDSLTGLYNRRQMEQELLRMFSHARRRDEPMGALMIDVDHFKNVNDTLGHAAGDQVLRSLAATLQATLTPDDVVGRWGGEEFLVLSNSSDIASLAVLAERIRQATEADRVDVPGAADMCVTVSIGCATSHRDEEPEVLLRRADRALYAAKDGGRNKIMSAE